MLLDKTFYQSIIQTVSIFEFLTMSLLLVLGILEDIKEYNTWWGRWQCACDEIIANPGKRYLLQSSEDGENADRV